MTNFNILFFLSENVKILCLISIVSCSSVDMNEIGAKAKQAGATEQNSSKVSGTEIGNGKELSGTEVGNGKTESPEIQNQMMLTCIYNPPSLTGPDDQKTAKYSCAIGGLAKDTDPATLELNWHLKDNGMASARLIRSAIDPLSFEILVNHTPDSLNQKLELELNVTVPGFEPTTVKKALVPSPPVLGENSQDLAIPNIQDNIPESSTIENQAPSISEPKSTANPESTIEPHQNTCTSQSGYLISQDLVSNNEIGNWCIGRGGVIAEVYSYQLGEISQIIDAGNTYRIGSWNGDSYNDTCLGIKDLTVVPLSCRNDAYVLCSCP